MTEDHKTTSATIRTVAVLVTALLVIGTFATVFILRSGTNAVGKAANTAAPVQDWPTPPPTFTPVDYAFLRRQQANPTPTPIAPPTWSELGNLTSVRFNASTIVHEERQQLLGKDQLIMMVVGDVLMGIDLKQIKPEDVQIDGRTIKLALPPASITSVELQLDKSQIYDSSNALLWSDSTGLEKNAIENAQRQLYDYSVNNESMIKTTQLLAKLQLSDFLQKLGFKNVEITFKERGEKWDD
ncbi:MAG: DUF4230 domain-containing protein [Caldilineaceae bacterium]